MNLAHLYVKTENYTPVDPDFPGILSKNLFYHSSIQRPTGVESGSRAWKAREIPVYDGRDWTYVAFATVFIGNRREPTECL
jgi:hypothetical protein